MEGNDQLRKFIIKKIVGNVEYNPDTNQYTVNKIQLTDSIWDTIIYEASKYGLDEAEARDIVAAISMDIKVAPSINSVRSITDFRKIQTGQYIKLSFLSEIGPLYIELIHYKSGSPRFFVVRSTVPDLSFGDDIVFVNNEWYISYCVIFQVYRNKKRYPENNAFYRLPDLQSIDYYSASVIHQILDSESNYSKEELDNNNNAAIGKDNVDGKEFDAVFNELLSDIRNGVRQNSIESEYKDLLWFSNMLGLSSFILNELIIEAKNQLDSNSVNEDKNLESFLFVNRPQTKVETKIVYKEPDIRGLHKRTGTGYVVAALMFFVGVCFYLLYGMNNEMNKANSLLSKVNHVVSDFHAAIEPDRFSSWTSTNKKDNTVSSKELTLDVHAGEELSFNYEVSSEYKYDFLSVTLLTSGLTQQLVRVSGIESGIKHFVFPSDGEVLVRFEYRKDGSDSRNEDSASVTDICLYKSREAQRQLLNNWENE